MPRSKAELDEKRHKYLALKELKRSRGWSELETILRDEFSKALDEVSSPKTVKAEMEARGVIKFIKRLTDTIDTEMKFGELAQKEYIEKHINPPKDHKSETA